MEFERTEIPIHFRSRDELEKPFKDPESPVVKTGLVLVSMETNVVQCPFREKCTKLAKGHGNGTYMR